jgi:hypothetical protein
MFHFAPWHHLVAIRTVFTQHHPSHLLHEFLWSICLLRTAASDNKGHLKRSPRLRSNPILDTAIVLVVKCVSRVWESGGCHQSSNLKTRCIAHLLHHGNSQQVRSASSFLYTWANRLDVCSCFRPGSTSEDRHNCNRLVGEKVNHPQRYEIHLDGPIKLWKHSWYSL